MPVTTWATGKKNPLILYPALASMPYNWSSEDVWAGVDWLAETSTPARDSTVAKFGTYSIKFTGGATQSALDRFTYDTTIWGAVNAGPYSCYCWVYPTAYTSNATVRLSLSLTKAAGVALTTPSDTTADYLVSGLTLNAWNLIRVVAAELTAAQQAEFVSVDYRVQLLPGVGTATFYADGMHFGYALDGQDIGINNDGAWAVTPYNPRKTYNKVSDRIANGITDGKAFNDGFHKGRFNWNNLREADREAYRKFIDYGADKSTFTMLTDQSTTDRDYYGECVLISNNYGEKQIDGHPGWTAGFDFEEVL